MEIRLALFSSGEWHIFMRQSVRSCEEASRVATRRSRRQGIDTVKQRGAGAERLVQLGSVGEWKGRTRNSGHTESSDRPRSETTGATRTSAGSPSHHEAINFVRVGRGQVHEQHQSCTTGSCARPFWSHSRTLAPSVGQQCSCWSPLSSRRSPCQRVHPS